jgi:tetratricopeptide (TPR) repeat protein
MRKQAWAFLLVGFIAGFAIFYYWTKQRAPEIVKAMPQPVQNASVSGRPGQTPEPAAPPVDAARVAQLEAEIKNNPKNFDALIELGNVYFDQKNFERCIELYTKGLELRPNEVDIRTDLGTAMFYIKRYDDAIAQFKKSLELDPKNAQTLFNLGVAMLHGKGDAPAALQYWEKLVETNPNYSQIDFVKEQVRLLKEQQKKP